METTPSVTSIITVLELSDTVIRQIGRANGQKDERRSLRDKVRTCNSLLQQLKDESSDSEGGRAWTDTIKALESYVGPLNRLYITHNYLRRKLVPKNSLVKIFVWPLKAREVRKVGVMIDQDNTLLKTALQNNPGKLIQQISKSAKRGHQLITELKENFKIVPTQNQSHLEELIELPETPQRRSTDRDSESYQKYVEKRKAALDWLADADDYISQHQDIFIERQSGTGKWLVDLGTYRNWINASGQTFFCPGIPGSGKTFLTAAVIEDLRDRYRNNHSVAVAYLYCNYKRHEEQRLHYLLSGLLRQLVEGQEMVPKIVKDLYDRHQKDETKPTLAEISRSLQSVAALYSKVFILVDALDECQEEDDCQSKLITELFALQQKCKINLFATSRDIPAIVERFEGAQKETILATDEDMGLYIDACMLYEFSDCTEDLKTEIKSQILKSASGVFLLAKLHMDSLLDKRSPKAVRMGMKKFAYGQNACGCAHSSAMERIEGQAESQKKLAKQILMWITLAPVPLTTAELQHAIGTEINTAALDKANLIQIEDLVSLCAGLVVYDEESNIVRLAHHTTQEYLEATRERWFSDAQREITQVCLTYLSFDEFQQAKCDEKALEKRTQTHALYLYAARYWGHHARLAPSSETERIMSFLKQSDSRNAAMQVAEMFGEGDSWRPYPTLDKIPSVTSLHFAAYHGIKRAIRPCLSEEVKIDHQNEDGRTALSYAAKRGHELVVELLLENGANPNLLDRWSQSPLSYALKHERIVRTLLGYKADPNLTRGKALPPLLRAALEGHEAAVETLLEFGADVRACNFNGSTALSFAAQQGFEAISRSLLASGADPNAGQWNTPITRAAARGYEAIVKALIQKGGDVNARDRNGKTALIQAALGGHEGVVTLLAKRGANVNMRDDSGKTALMHAASGGYESIALFLTARSAVYVPDNDGRSALAYAATKGHDAVVKLLLKKGIDINTRDNRGRTALAWAMANRHETTKVILLNHGARG